MPRLAVVERDYAAVAEKMAALGPLAESAGTGVKGISWKPAAAIDHIARTNGRVRGGIAAGCPALALDIHFAEAILALSGTSNGEVAMRGWQALEERTGVRLADLAEERAGDRISFADTQVQPRAVITSPEWSGSETGGRRYSPFVVNVERKKPWHTLTGRVHFFLGHDWIAEYGEWLPVYRPRWTTRHFGEQGLREEGHPEITVRYLTPHSKWSIHSEYQDNLHMLRLFRGGPVIWMSLADAARIGVADNDWIEAYNRNGVVACRAVVTHRMPEGTVFMYHAKDRHLMTPKSEVSGWHGGSDNSLTRLVIKPTHMIGGYGRRRCCCSIRRRAVRRARRTRRVRRDHVPPAGAGRLRPVPGLVADHRPADVAQHYVQTFDLRRRCTLYLTYYRYGDTRKRSLAMLAFKTAYRNAGFIPREDELPDYMPMVLDFAALTGRGQRLLRSRRADLELLRRALARAGSPYEDVVAAICAQLPRLSRHELG
jgi:nitrate reductase molybdenum cofactor assembly chaperone